MPHRHEPRDTPLQALGLHDRSSDNQERVCWTNGPIHTFIRLLPKVHILGMFHVRNFPTALTVVTEKGQAKAWVRRDCYRPHCFLTQATIGQVQRKRVKMLCEEPGTGLHLPFRQASL